MGLWSRSAVLQAEGNHYTLFEVIIIFRAGDGKGGLGLLSDRPEFAPGRRGVDLPIGRDFDRLLVLVIGKVVESIVDELVHRSRLLHLSESSCQGSAIDLSEIEILFDIFRRRVHLCLRVDGRLLV
jgi:hypothetical protein